MGRNIRNQAISVSLAGMILIITGLFLVIDDWFLHFIYYSGYGGPDGPWFFSHDIYGIIMIIVGVALISSMSRLLKKGFR